MAGDCGRAAAASGTTEVYDVRTHQPRAPPRRFAKFFRARCLVRGKEARRRAIAERTFQRQWRIAGEYKRASIKEGSEPNGGAASTSSMRYHFMLRKSATFIMTS